MNDEKNGSDTPKFNGLEDEYTEFKREWSESIIKTAVAFANTRGGNIYIGIADNGDIIGIPKDKLDGTTRQIVQSIKSQTGLSVHTENIGCDEKIYVKIHIDVSNEVIKSKKDNNYYHRTGPQNSIMTPDDITNVTLEKRRRLPNAGDVLAIDEPSFHIAKEILLRARQFGETFFHIAIWKNETTYFVTEGDPNQFFCCSQKIAYIALNRLLDANLIKANANNVVINIEGIAKHLNPPVNLKLSDSRTYGGYIITEQGLLYCKKHQADLASLAIPNLE